MTLSTQGSESTKSVQDAFCWDGKRRRRNPIWTVREGLYKFSLTALINHLECYVDDRC